ncbi:MAG: hypothetical protein HWN66_06945 [Candidatus Helarchaeota archaeon]|nr:hypothetical protein [Candidatus Helarchaeota archaeon]
MGLLGRIGRRIGREVGRELEEGIKREITKIEDRIEGKLEKWEKDLVKKVTSVNKHIKGKIITDFNEFKTDWEKNAGDQSQSVFYFAIACYNYCLVDKTIGEHMATLILAKTFLLKSGSSPTKFKVNPKGDGYLLGHMRESPRIIKSYFGGTPDNNYEMDPENLDMHVVGIYEGKTNRGIPEGCIKIQSGGKDHDTPMFLRRNNKGQWKMFGFSSLATGVKTTTEEIGDF